MSKEEMAYKKAMSDFDEAMRRLVKAAKKLGVKEPIQRKAYPLHPSWSLRSILTEHGYSYDANGTPT